MAQKVPALVPYMVTAFACKADLKASRATPLRGSEWSSTYFELIACTDTHSAVQPAGTCTPGTAAIVQAAGKASSCSRRPAAHADQLSTLQSLPVELVPASRAEEERAPQQQLSPYLLQHQPPAFLPCRLHHHPLYINKQQTWHRQHCRLRFQQSSVRK